MALRLLNSNNPPRKSPLRLLGDDFMPEDREPSPKTQTPLTGENKGKNGLRLLKGIDVSENSFPRSDPRNDPDYIQRGIGEAFKFGTSEIGDLIDITRKKWRKGHEGINIDANWGQAMYKEKSVADAAQDEDVFAQEYAQYPDADIPFEKHPLKHLIGAGAEMAPFMWRSTMKGAEGALKGAVAGGTAGLVAGGPDVGDIGLMGAGAKVGAVYNTLDYTTRVEGGGVFKELIKNDVDEDVARAVAIPAGLISGAIELAQLDMLVASPLRRAFAKKLIKNPTVAGAIKKGITTYLKTYAGEVSEEGLQKITTNTFKMFGEYIDGKIPQEEMSAEGIAKRIMKDMSQEMIGAAKGMLFFPGGTAIQATAQGVGQAKTMRALEKLGYTAEDVQNRREEIIKELSALEKAFEKAEDVATRIAKDERGFAYIGPRAKGFEGMEGKFSSLADKKIRVEIPDNLTFFKEGAIKRINKPMTYLDKSFPLSEIYGHRKLYEAYPELKNIGIRVKDMPAIGDKGFYDEVNNTIVINRGAMDKGLESVEETLLHEIQHYIQRVEGFARGGSPAEFKVAKDEAMSRINFLNAQLSEAAKKLEDKTLSSEQKQQYRDQYDSAMNEKLNIDPIIVQADTYDQYRKLAGEVEARDVAFRKNLTPEERRTKPPLESQGVSLEDMIVKMDSKESLSTEEQDLYDKAKKYKTAEEFLGKDEVDEGVIPGEPNYYIGGIENPRAMIIEDVAGEDGESLGYKVQLSDGRILSNPLSDKIGGDPYFENQEEAIKYAKAQLTDIWNKANEEKPKLRLLEEPVSEKSSFSQPQIVSDLKDITAKINELTLQNKPIPDSLIKRQEAIITALEGGERVDTKKSAPSAKKILGQQPAERVTRSETSLLKDRMRTLSRGARMGEKMTKDQIEGNVKEIKKLLSESNLEAKDIAKFIGKLTNIPKLNYPELKFQNILRDIESRINELENAELIRSYRTRIERELKGTKPRKQGATTKGKYDYQTNEFFKTLQRFRKMNQTQAQQELENFGEPETEMEAIQKRYLSLQANGANSSPQLVQKVLEDIQNAKTVGEAYADYAAFTDAINQREKITEVRSGIKNMRGGGETSISNVKTRIVNMYRQGFSNLFSMLNSTVNRSVAEKYKAERLEAEKQTAIYDKTIEVTQRVSDIFGVSNEKILSEFARMTNEKFSLVDFDNETHEINKMDIIDIYNGIKNDKTREAFYDAYGEDQILNIVSELSADEQQVADYLQEVAQSYYPVFNQRNIELNAEDLGRIDNYWPRTSEKPIKIYDDIRIQGETSSARKERARGRVIPVPKNAWLKLLKHISEGEHERHLSPRYAELKRIFSDRKVRIPFVNKYGENVYNTLIDQIDDLSLNKQIEKIDAITGLMGKALNNWVTAKIALSPSVFMKQLISIINYSEVMPVKTWTKYFAEGLLHPKKTFDYVWNNVPYLEARFNIGYSEALNRVLKDASKASKLKGDWVNAMTSLARMGDIGAIIYGGYPLLKFEMERTGNMDKAVDIFVDVTLSSQQSGFASSLSRFQNSRSSLVRLFLAFKNTANQYFRKQVDAIISHSNGDITSGQLAKTLAIYSIIQPSLYGIMSMAMANLLYRPFADDDEEEGTEWFDNMMMFIALNPFMAIPVIDDMAEYAYRKLTGKKVWRVFSTPLFDDIELGVKKLGKKEPTIYDVMEMAATIIEPTTGAPIKTYTRMGKKFFAEGKKTDAGNRTLRLLPKEHMLPSRALPSGQALPTRMF
jgi:hypothetical protein